jgi:hypothetical protein
MGLVCLVTRRLERRCGFIEDLTNVEDSRKDKVEFLNELNYTKYAI